MPHNQARELLKAANEEMFPMASRRHITSAKAKRRIACANKNDGRKRRAPLGPARMQMRIAAFAGILEVC